MRSIRTLSRWAGAVALLAGSLTSQAQTSSAPAWADARGISSGSVTKAVTDAAGNTYVTGIFDAAAPVEIGGTTLTSQGGNDGYLAKLTPGGTLAWVRQFGSTGYDACQGVAVDATGNAYVVGSFSGVLDFGAVVLNGGPSPRGYVVRFDAQGTASWGQVLTTSSLADVATNAAGEVYVVGLFSQALTVGPFTLTPPNTGGISSTFLLRYSAQGTVLQASVAYTYVPNTTTTYYFPSLAVGPGGEVYVYGVFVGSPQFGSTVVASRGAVDGFVAKYNPQGTFGWVQQVGGSGDDRLRQISADAAGNVYATGSFTGPATIGAATLPGSGGPDGYVARFDAQGALQWTQVLGGSGVDGCLGNLVDAAGNLHVSGLFNGTATLAGTTLSSAGGSDILLASFTPQGTLRWTQQAGGPGNDSGLYLTLDGSQQLRVLGAYANNCRFGTQTLTTPTSAYYMATTGTVAGLRPGRGLQALHLYPSPARTTVQVAGLPAGLPVQLYDALGRVVRAAVSGPAGVSVQGLAPGLYTLRAADGQGQQYVGRLLVE